MAVAWVFPGQGSQRVAMGRDVYEANAAAQRVFEEADAVLGFGLTTLCFEGPTETLTQTENAQPALLTVEAALLAAAGWDATAATALDLERPQLLAGHSLGEYTALYAAGALSFATALQLVRRRGELMAAAREGAMAAVIGLEASVLAEVCREASALGPVVIANENAPGQLVISGATAAVTQAGELAKRTGAKRVMPLPVSAAFHSPLMQDAAQQLALAVDAAEIRPAIIPVVGNVHAQPLTSVQAIRDELVSQVTAPVKWIDTIAYMHSQGITEIVEWGPGTVLTGLVKRIAPGVALRNVSDDASLKSLL